jgi:hypothetical protein
MSNNLSIPVVRTLKGKMPLEERGVVDGQFL